MIEPVYLFTVNRLFDINLKISPDLANKTLLPKEEVNSLFPASDTQLLILM
jgi:hypothetical protein